MHKKLKREDKAWAQRAHAIKRLRQRYRINIDIEEYHRICNYIKDLKEWPIGDTPYAWADGTSVLLYDYQTNRVSVWYIWYKGQRLIASYDKSRKSISSFLPKDATDKFFQTQTMQLRDIEHRTLGDIYEEGEFNDELM